LVRRKIWIPINSGSSVAAGASTHIDLLGAMPSQLQETGGLTVERIVGEFKYRTEVVGTYQNFSAAIGVMVEEVGTTTSMNISGEARNWMWTLFTRTSGMFSEAAAGDFDSIEEVRFLDVRSARKIPANSELRLTISNGSGQTIFFLVGLRTLVLLP